MHKALLTNYAKVVIIYILNKERYLMKRTAALLICLVMCVSVLLSCSGEKRHDIQVGLIETTLHRENPEGVFGNKDYPYGTAVSDSIIKESALAYEDYVTQQGNKLHPGFMRLKEVYVENLSNEDIYVRVIATFPAAFCKEDDPVMDIRYCEEAENDRERGFTVSRSYDSEGNYVMVFTYQNPIAKGEMTYWPSLCAFGIRNDVSTDKIMDTFNSLGDKPFDVAVAANAITAKDYPNAAAAFEAYDKHAAEQQ